MPSLSSRALPFSARSNGTYYVIRTTFRSYIAELYNMENHINRFLIESLKAEDFELSLLQGFVHCRRLCCMCCDPEPNAATGECAIRPSNKVRHANYAMSCMPSRLLTRDTTTPLVVPWPLISPDRPPTLLPALPRSDAIEIDVHYQV